MEQQEEPEEARTASFDPFAGMCKGCRNWLNKPPRPEEVPVLGKDEHDDSITGCGKEFVVLFESDGSLGLQFEVEEGGSAITVKAVVDNSQAADVCLINKGDELVGVNSMAFAGKDFDEAMALIQGVKEHDNEIRLHFHPHPDRKKGDHEVQGQLHAAAALSEVF